MPHRCSLTARARCVLGSLRNVLVGAGLLACRTAVAQPSAASTAPFPTGSVGLRWDGLDESAGCLGARALSRSVEDYLGRSIFSEGPTDLVVTVHAEPPRGSSYRALIELSRGGSNVVVGERELVVEGTSCASLNEPLVLAVGLMVDGEPAVAREPEPEVRPPARAHDFELMLSLLGQAVTLPKPGPGAELALSYRLAGQMFARLEVGAFLPVAAAIAPPAEADLGFAFGGLGLCQGAAVDPAITLRFCGAALLAHAYATTDGIEGGTGQSATVLGAELGVEGTTHANGWLFLATSLRVRLFPSAPRFVYSVDKSRENVFEYRHFDAVASLGLGVTF